MNAAPSWSDRADAASLFEGLRQAAGELRAFAGEDDVSEEFPTGTLDVLRRVGCLTAVLPDSRGGMGLGWKQESRRVLLDLLRGMGGVHLSAARLFEGHVNAFQLIWLYGTAMQRDALCAYVGGGGLLGVWNAPSPAGDLVLETATSGTCLLHGPKAYASGAGRIGRPLVTARHPERGWLMVWPDLPYQVGAESEWQMQGMRASTTRPVAFDGPVGEEQIIGASDDYHRQPCFSGGAWRFLAAQLGAAEALVEEMRATLRLRRRHEDPHQQVRMAECVVALESCLLWVDHASRDAFDDTLEASQVIRHVNSARIAVEDNLLRVIGHVQRSVGLGAFSRTCAIERISRDLATYLRQPAPDALREAVGSAACEQALPGLTGASYGSER